MASNSDLDLRSELDVQSRPGEFRPGHRTAFQFSRAGFEIQTLSGPPPPCRGSGSSRETLRFQGPSASAEGAQVSPRDPGAAGFSAEQKQLGPRGEVREVQASQRDFGTRGSARDQGVCMAEEPSPSAVWTEQVQRPAAEHPQGSNSRVSHAPDSALH